MIKKTSILFLLAYTVVSFQQVSAAVDAGVLQDYQEIPKPSLKNGTRTDPEIERTQPVQEVQATTKVRVTKFAIEGATLIQSDELESLVNDFIGRDLTLQDIYSAAARITDVFHAKGYPLVNTYVPPQTISDGVVKLIVLESKYGTIAVVGSPRLPENKVSNILSAQGIGTGIPIHQDALERSLLLLQNMPGTDAALSLRSGTTPGTSDITVEAKAKNLISGQISADNHGARYIGENRLTTRLSLNSPYGWGDQFDLRWTHAKDHDFGTVSYAFPIGNSGLKLGGGVSRLDYRLCCDLSVLDWKGEMTTLSAYGVYPLVLTKARKLIADITYFDRHLKDDVLGVELREGEVRAGQLSLRGALSGRAETRFNMTLTGANLDLSGNAANQSQDASTADTEGGFWKARGYFQQRWPVFSTAWLDYRLSGQWASKNLDISEKFLLGGPDGVRAYPLGEGAGDMGLLARIELGTGLPLPVPGQVTSSIFFDTGTTWVNKNTWSGALLAGQSNHYALSGLGASATWALPQQVTAEASIATTLGSNDGNIAGGNDSDGRNRHTRAWASLRWDF